MTTWALSAGGHRRGNGTSDLLEVEAAAEAFLKVLENNGHVIAFAHINDKDIRPHGPEPSPERTPEDAA